MSGLYWKTKKWVEKIYFNANHLIRTVYWVKKLNPQASEALVFAALTHDIERAFSEGRKPPIDEFGGKWDSPIYNKWHSKRSAKFVADFFEKQRVDLKLIKRVGGLIKRHEIGGTKEADLLRDADSLSFLEINAPVFISWIPERMSKKSVKGKLDYMFNRIGNPKAKNLAKPFYEKAILEVS